MRFILYSCRTAQAARDPPRTVGQTPSRRLFIQPQAGPQRIGVVSYESISSRAASRSSLVKAAIGGSSNVGGYSLSKRSERAFSLRRSLCWCWRLLLVDQEGPPDKTLRGRQAKVSESTMFAAAVARSGAAKARPPPARRAAPISGVAFERHETRQRGRQGGGARRVDAQA